MLDRLRLAEQSCLRTFSRRLKFAASQSAPFVKPPDAGLGILSLDLDPHQYQPTSLGKSTVQPNHSGLRFG